MERFPRSHPILSHRLSAGMIDRNAGARERHLFSQGAALQDLILQLS